VSENLVVIVTAVRELAWHDVNIEISYAPVHKADWLISRTDDFPMNGAEENARRHGRFVTMICEINFENYRIKNTRR